MSLGSFTYTFNDHNNSGESQYCPHFTDQKTKVLESDWVYRVRKGQTKSLHPGLGNWSQTLQSLSYNTLEDEYLSISKRVGWNKCEERVLTGQARNKPGLMLRTKIDRPTDDR